MPNCSASTAGSPRRCRSPGRPRPWTASSPHPAGIRTGSPRADGHTSGLPSDRVRDGPDTGMGAEILEEYGLALTIGERDPPVRVFVRRAGHVLRLPLAHRVG